MSSANDVVLIACNGVRKMTTHKKDPEPVSLLRPEQYRVTQQDGTERPFFRTNSGTTKR